MTEDDAVVREKDTRETNPQEIGGYNCALMLQTLAPSIRQRRGVGGSDGRPSRSFNLTITVGGHRLGITQGCRTWLFPVGQQCLKKGYDMCDSRHVVVKQIPMSSCLSRAE